MDRLRFCLRFVALFGPLGMLAWEALAHDSLVTNAESGIVVVVLAWLVLLFSLPGLISAMPGDLFVPLGVYLTVSPLLGRLLQAIGVALLGPQGPATILGVAFTLNVAFFAQGFLAVFHAGWATRLILQAGRGEPVDPAAPLLRPWGWFGQSLLVCLLGWGVLFGGFALVLPLGKGAIGLLLILIAVGSLLWNLATAALLPVVLAGGSLGQGLRTSWRNMDALWGPVLLQMLLLGWITYHNVTFTARDQQGNSKTVTTSSWNVNGFWTGGYEDNCRWYSKVREITQAGPAPVVGTFAVLPFALLAIAVKLIVVRRLHARGELGPASEPVNEVPIRRGFDLRPVALLLWLGAGTATAFLYQRVTERGSLRWFRSAIARGETEDNLKRALKNQPNIRQMTERLVSDPDPAVRRAVVPILVGEATPARRKDPSVGFSESWNGLGNNEAELLIRLLDDPDPEVRLATLRAVTPLRALSHSNLVKPLLRVLHEGAVEERIVVAESLAHWEDSSEEFWKTFADPGQPRAVRLAVIRGADQRYGWYQPTRRDFTPLIRPVLDENDHELRRAALGALRFTQKGVDVWFELLEKRRDGDELGVYRIWVNALVEEPAGGGEHYPLLETTETLLFRHDNRNTFSIARGDDGKVKVERIAWVVALLCEAARENTRLLGRAAPVNWQQAITERNRGGGPAAQAFVAELHRLQQVLRALCAVRRFCQYEETRDLTFTAWLPHEKQQGAPPARKLKDFLLEQAREPLAWCRQQGGRYASPFLRVNGFQFSHEVSFPQNEPVSLGRILQALSLDTDQAVEALLKGRK